MYDHPDIIGDLAAERRTRFVAEARRPRRRWADTRFARLARIRRRSGLDCD